MSANELAVPRAVCTVLPAVLLGMLLIGGCARQPAPDLYILDLPQGTAVSGPAQGPSVGIGPLTLPPYLDRPQIVTRDGAYRLRAAQAQVWAEPVADGITRVLSDSLGRELGSNRVVVVPQRAREPLDWRVAIDIRRFDGTPGGTVVLAAGWTIYRGGAGEAEASHTAVFEQAVEGGDYAALVAAEAAAVARLGQAIAAGITAADRGAAVRPGRRQP
ncbi:MAG: membrane integrity-associated transporter subunit PqiC [Gammaproteobacteria bacterium]|nr:membrane integrity-associated transporter subunit PqiC [Gammaproteobacteria bacterium]